MGIKIPKSDTTFGRAALLRARVNDGGFYRGAGLLGPSDDGKGLVLQPVPQFGVSDESGKQVWLEFDELPQGLSLRPTASRGESRSR